MGQHGAEPVADAPRDLHEESLFLLGPDRGAPAPVQAERIRVPDARTDGRRHPGANGEWLCQLRTDLVLRPRPVLNGRLGRREHGERPAHPVRHGELRPYRGGSGIFGPGALHGEAPDLRVRIAGLDEPCSVAVEHVEQDVERPSKHLVYVVRALDDAIDAVQALQKPEMVSRVRAPIIDYRWFVRCA